MILLDTHALIWWVQGPDSQLSPRARSVIQTEMAGGEILVSSISAWEVALLVSRQRLGLTFDTASFLLKIAAIACVRVVPVDNEIAVGAVNLPDWTHRDPADRFLAATARHFGCPIVSADARMLSYPHIQTIW